MAVTLRVTGNGHFAGAQTALSGYSVTEDSTPIVGSDSSGGVGQLTFDVNEDAASDGTILLLNDTVDLEDGSNGRTQGKVSGVSGTDGEISVTADSRLGALMATRTAQGYNGTLSGAFFYYLSLAGITTGISVDTTIGSRAVTFPGWTGNVWDYIKQMCVAQQVEVSLVSSNIVLRPLRTRTAIVAKDATRSWAVQNVDLAQNIEINYYNNAYTTNGLAYPQGGWSEDVQIYQVDAGQTLEVDIPVNVSLTSVNQPVAQDFVDRYFTGPTSVYSVAGNDGLGIPAAQWVAQGGKIVANIGVLQDDGTYDSNASNLHLTIIGAAGTDYAPYRIAVTAGPSDYYSSLRLTGTGVFFEKKTLTIPTGAPADKTAQLVGVTIDNPFISSLADAYDAGMRAAGAWASPMQTINIKATVINRQGDAGTVNYPTFVTFDTVYAGKTFGQFDTLMGTQTYDQFTAAQFALVKDNFENQAFGNVSGSRVKFRDSWYRIRSATITPDGISYSAERDTLLGDFDAIWAGKTFAQFDTRWAGKSFEDMGVISLWQ